MLLCFNGATLSCLLQITTYVMLINTTLVPAHDFAGSKSSVVKYTKQKDLETIF